MLFEFGFVIGDSGIENGLKNEDITNILKESFSLFFKILEVENITIDKSALLSFMKYFSKFLSSEEKKVLKKPLLPYQFKGFFNTVKDLKDACKKSPYYKKAAEYRMLEFSFLYPENICVKDEFIYVNDDRGLHKFDLEGVFIETKSEYIKDMYFSAEVRDGAGSKYVLNDELCCIEKYDARGDIVFKIGKRGKKYGEFINPTKIAVDNRGNVYVVDKGNNRIQKFDSNGNYICQAGGTRGKGLGEFYQPKDIAFDKKGNLWIERYA
ncbi:MAG: hypothetical protein DRP78_01120 [Candidatus Omnitrophota bacterium]|nr:MAG: hypothetical protein DRP78_01120 [Candidatus Omnitrophota bacterium]